jgi:hypothetical protein
LEKHVPSSVSRSNKNSPWITKKTRRAIRRKHRLYKKAKKSNTPQSWAKYKEAKRQNQTSIRKAHIDYVNNVLTLSLENHNSKPLWQYLKSQKEDNVGVAPIKANGKLYADPKDKAELINNQFQSVFTKAESTTNAIPDGDPYPDIKELNITTDGILKLLKDIKINKASGPDAIPNILLKELATELAPIIQSLFTQSLKTGELPPDWRNANVSPLFKKGDRHLPVNYRPVSLTCVVCKVFEHIICKHILDHTDLHNILTNLQHGFRKGRSCETQLVLTMQDLFEANDRKREIDIAVLDFSKAFDTVPHQLLVNKLHHYGIRGNLLNWIDEFLSNREQCVVVEGVSSEKVHVDSGVPQGTVLGPLMFLLFINDLPQQVSSQVRLFADDCLLYRTIDTQEDQVKLQSDLIALERWAKKWGMKFNAKKCNILQISRSQPLIHFYKLCGHILEEVSEAKYLGVTISNSLKWDTHIDNISAKSNRTLGFLRRNLKKCPQKLKEQSYIALVRSTLEYSSSIWDPYYKKDIEKLHKVEKRAARFVTSQYSNESSISDILDSLGWQSLETRRREARLALFFKIAKGLVAVDKDVYLTQGESRTRSANNMKFRQLKTTTTQYQNSFFPRTIPEWNNLPQSTIDSDTVKSFKVALHD